MKYTGYNDVDIRDALTKYFSHTLNRNEKVDEVMRSYDTWDKNFTVDSLNKNRNYKHHN